MFTYKKKQILLCFYEFVLRYVFLKSDCRFFVSLKFFLNLKTRRKYGFTFTLNYCLYDKPSWSICQYCMAKT